MLGCHSSFAGAAYGVGVFGEDAALESWFGGFEVFEGRVFPSSEMLSVSLRLGMSKVMVSPSRTAAMGPPSWASGATWPAMRPRVAPEKRPSVSRATEFAQLWNALMAAVTASIAHAVAAARAFVADDEDVVGVDLAVLNGVECVLLAVEDAGGAGVVEAFVAGDLDDAAVGCEIAAEDDEAAGGLERLVPVVDDGLAGSFDGGVCFGEEVLAADGGDVFQRAAVFEALGEEA